MNIRPIMLLALTPLLLANGEPSKKKNAPLPPGIQMMLDAAIASGNSGEVDTVAKYARAAAPDSSDLIDTIVDSWKGDKTEATNRHLQEADLFELVKGHAELGGIITTGNTSTVGLSGVLDLKREGFRWRHKLHFQADYQESHHIPTQERYLASYEPNLKLGKKAYVYGALQYERDRFSGYYNRASVSTGLGYSLIQKPTMHLNVELGPAYRYTDFINEDNASNFAGRGSIDFGWQLSRGVALTQNASAYLQSSNSTIAAKTALNVKLFGPLSTQLSYALQFESAPPAGRQTTDSTSRAALVIDF